MFVYTVRASRVKFFAVLALLTVTALGVLLVVGRQPTAVETAGDTYRFTGVREEADRVAFFGQFDIAVSGEPEVEDFLMPDNFDRVMLGYNEIQKTQGLDISKYTKKKVTRYTYAIENGEAFATALVYRGRVIAADVTSPAEGKVYALLDYKNARAGQTENENPPIA